MLPVMRLMLHSFFANKSASQRANGKRYRPSAEKRKKQRPNNRFLIEIIRLLMGLKNKLVSHNPSQKREKSLLAYCKSKLPAKQMKDL
jgi:hypothetical protein